MKYGLRVLMALVLTLGVSSLPSDVMAGKKKKKANKVFKKAKKGTKNTAKKGAKASEKAGAKAAKKTSDKDIAAARKELKKAGKTVNKVTGQISGTVTKAYALTKKELDAAAKYAAKQAKKQMTKLAMAAFKKIIKPVFMKNIKKYGKLLGKLFKETPKLQKDLFEVAGHLFVGNFRKAEQLTYKVMRSKALKPIFAEAHKLIGTSFVIVASGSGAFQFATGYAGFGIAVNLHPGANKNVPAASIFFYMGAGATTSNLPTGGIAVNVGFLKGNPNNIGGVFIDAGGSGPFPTSLGLSTNTSWNVGFGFSPPTGIPKPSNLIPALYTFGAGYGASAKGAANWSVFLGSSCTVIIQNIRNKNSSWAGNESK